MYGNEGAPANLLRGGAGLTLGFEAADGVALGIRNCPDPAGGWVANGFIESFKVCLSCAVKRFWTGGQQIFLCDLLYDLGPVSERVTGCGKDLPVNQLLRDEVRLHVLSSSPHVFDQFVDFVDEKFVVDAVHNK